MLVVMGVAIDKGDYRYVSLSVSLFLSQFLCLRLPSGVAFIEVRFVVAGALFVSTV